MTTWQDMALFVVGILFLLNLVPTVYAQWKIKMTTVPMVTSIPYALGLFVVGFVMATLELYAGAAVTWLAAGMWSVIAAQRWRYGDGNKRKVPFKDTWLGQQGHPWA